jgi:uncharacterized protein YndB with AHSA1/START domain
MKPWKSGLALSTLLACCSCTTVRQLRDPASLPADGHAVRTRDEHALDYSVAIHIAASPQVVWDILADGPSYKGWNTTIIKLDGAIALGSEIHLISTDKPDKTFDLKVSTFEAPKKMIWEDGGSMFLGVRNFTLIPVPDGTTFAMSETFSGGMLGMIEGSLPDFTKTFDTFAADLKKQAEGKTGASR